MLVYIFLSNERKRRHAEEKQEIRRQFQTELIKAGMEAQEQMRQNIAGELHDNIGQILSLLSITLATLDVKETEKLDAKIRDAKELVAKSIKELRQLSKVNYGEDIIHQGLEQSVRQEIYFIQKNRAIEIDYQCRSEGAYDMDADRQLFTFRIVQESLNNILKHSRASRASVLLEFCEKHLVLSIADNGIGFDV
ncbi:MAG: hypothetical protein JST39_02120, partial [Bacteroidetes bacterium]|nr:hypothetical protein [Bacteroidota bacterium]